MLQFSHGIYSLKVVFLGSAVPLGWWIHFHTRFLLHPFACTLVGHGAEVFVPGFDELSIMERVAAADLSELLVQFIGILFQFVIADTALHRKFCKCVDAVIPGAHIRVFLSFGKKSNQKKPT